MELIIITIIALVFIIILGYVFNYNISKIKAIADDKELDELSKKYTSNIEMCKWYLKKLKNENIKLKKEDYIKDTGPVDFGSVVWWKLPVLDRIAKWFLENCAEEDRVLYESFKNDNSSWLDSYANFMSIKSFYDKTYNDHYQ